jgi:hypothetical protein
LCELVLEDLAHNFMKKWKCQVDSCSTAWFNVAADQRVRDGRSGRFARTAEGILHIGRPSIDPELMIRMLMVGYCYGIRHYGIRHERRLCQEVALHLAYGSASSISTIRFRTIRPSR